MTKRLDLGAELVYQYGPHIPGEQVSVLSLAARINGKFKKFLFSEVQFKF